MTLSKDLVTSLQSSIRGQVYYNDDPNFVHYSTIFNGNVQTFAKAVACPLDAEDVSKIVVFCAAHSLSPSVKAGGYGTAGWAINGDIIIDLSRLGEVDIEAPNYDGSYTSLRDMAPSNSKGKKAITGLSAAASTSASGKRRREEDDALRSYGSASHAVDDFLQGPRLPPGDYPERPPPGVRRRLNSPPPESVPDNSDEPASTDGKPIVVSTWTFSPSEPLGAAVPTSSSQPPVPAPQMSHPPPADADPFGYIDSVPPPPAVSRQSHGVRWQGSSTSSNTLVANPRLPPANLSLRSQAEAIHSHAFVTFGAGMRQKEIDTYTANHPLQARSVSGGIDSIPYHVPFAAHPVGSSIMILGGFGFLSRLHGLSIDNLIEVEMVLADGSIVIVNENEYKDLWWAIRGAGPCFGIATRYKAKAFPVPSVFAGNLIYRFHRATAPSLIKHYRDCIKGAPRELYANVLLTAGPAGKDSLIVIQLCYVGAKEKGQEFLSALSAWDGEGCLLNEVDEKSFLHQQDSVAQVLRGKQGRQWFIRSALITSLPDEVINQTVNQFADTPLGCTWLFELAGGALPEFTDNCLPKAQREAAFTIAALHQWEMDVDDPRCVASAEEWIAGTLGPVQTGGPLPSFLGRNEPPERTISCYGENWDRLKELKQIYDPNNFFRNSLWPLNTKGEAVEARMHEPPSPTP